MSLIYKNKENMTMHVDIENYNGIVKMEFSSDCGKFGTMEALAGYKLTPERLLSILQDRDDYTEDEL